MAEYTEEQLQVLRDRWEGHEEELKALIPIIKADPKWEESEAYKALMEALGPLPEGVEEVKRDLRGVSLVGMDLSGANLREANLSKDILVVIGGHLLDLRNIYLAGADLSGANLLGVDLSRTILSGTNLSKANLMGADLSETSLLEADLSGANLFGVNLSKANLMGTDISRVYLRETNLSGTNLSQVLYTTDEIFNRLRRWCIPYILQYIPLAKHHIRKPVGITYFKGIDTTKIDGSKNPILKRHIEDYQFIQAFKTKGWFHRRIVYPLWKVTSDCGRSLLIWGLWSLAFALLFGRLYATHPTWFQQEMGPLSPWYFSVVTFTTLGFGDLTPKPECWQAQAWVMAEVILGYIMLGGLISIFANKLARRA